MAGRKERRFGNVRELPSGRFQARYRGPDGVMRSAPTLFASRKDAGRWLTLTEAEILRGDWRDPTAGAVQFGEYAERWITERPRLRPRTVDLYRSLLRRHVAPDLAGLMVQDITPQVVRSWRAGLLARGVSESTTAKAYRLIRAVMSTAVADDLVRRNPCAIPGAGTEPVAERPVVTVAQVFALAQAMPPRFRAFVLLATFAGLRFGELAALQRRHLDTEAGTVRVEETLIELSGGVLVTGPPKTQAGVRTVTLPPAILDDLRWHLSRFVGRSPSALVFVGPKGGRLRRGNFHRVWHRARVKAGVPALHLHDLRHTGNTLAAPHASLRELMARMGHASTRAALIYQHATRDRDREIAEALSTLAEQGRKRSTPRSGEDDDPGTSGVRVPVGA